ncbi:MAG TPA: putative aminohydrolase SsnA [Anaerolineales bacterium]|nr:putative aminohydrolase SsnA [Anaerolineales bacterium]
MLIQNATIITLEPENRILSDQTVLIEDGRIASIGPQKGVSTWFDDDDRIDAGGRLVLPGNICAHTHFYGAFARGMAIPGPAPRDFPEILQRLWWPLDKALDPESIRLSALVMLVDAIRNGTTTLIDHHASPNAIPGSLDAIADVVDAAGLRAVLCYEVTDRDGEGKARAGIEENLRALEKYGRPTDGGRVAATFGLHAGMTLSEATLAACREVVPEGTGFHIHVAEHEADEYDSLNRTGERVVDRLSRHGLLGPETIVAHAVHVDAAEIALLAETETWVTHQPRSNMNNGVGAAPVESLLRAGVRVCLGTDGFPHAMWEEARFAYMLQKLAHRDPRRMPGDRVFEMLTRNNADLAGRFFPGAALGVITEGAHADLIFVDYHPHTPLSPGNLPWQVIFGFHERMVTTTICAGRLLMHERELLTLDEAAIASAAREAAPEVWARYGRLVS